MVEESTIFEVHLGKGNIVTIEDKEYKLKSLGTDSLPHFFKAMKAFSGMDKDGKPEDMMKGMTDESTSALQYLIEHTLEKSFPEEWKKNSNQVKEFGMKYMMVLLPKIMEINSDQHANIEVKKKDKLMKGLAEQQAKK